MACCLIFYTFCFLSNGLASPDSSLSPPSNLLIWLTYLTLFCSAIFLSASLSNQITTHIFTQTKGISHSTYMSMFGHFCSFTYILWFSLLCFTVCVGFFVVVVVATILSVLFCLLTCFIKRMRKKERKGTHLDEEKGRI